MASAVSNECMQNVCMNIEVPPRLRNLYDLAMKYIAQHRHQMALSICNQSLAELEKLSGYHHPDVAVVLNILAVIYRELDNYEECDRLLNDAVIILKKAYGNLHPMVASTMNNLAVLYGTQGRNKEGEMLCRDALEIREKLYGIDHPEVAKQLGNLALLCQNQGKGEEAEKYFQQALMIFESSYGPSDVNVIKTKNNLASYYRRKGMYKEASLLYKQLLRRTFDRKGANVDEINGTPSSQFTKEVSVEYDIPIPLRNIHDTTMKHISQHNYMQAESVSKQFLAELEKTNGHDHPHVASMMNLLALAYQYQYKYDEAVKLLKEAVVIWEKTLGEHHPSVTAALNNLTVLYGKQGKNKEGEMACRRALEVREKVVGRHHPDVAKLLGNLALLLQNQGRYDGVEKYYQQALQIFEATLGPADPNIAKTKSNLASYYQKQGKYKEAVILYKQLLKGSNECFVTGHQTGHGETTLPPNEGSTEALPGNAHHTPVERPNTASTHKQPSPISRRRHQMAKKDTEESRTKHSNLTAEKDKCCAEGYGVTSKDDREKELYSYHMHVLKLQEKAETAKKRYYEEKMKRLSSK